MEICPNVSIIIPVYKAELYLKDCVRSILAQNYRDFELILVDDGSPDKSGELCDMFAKEDERVRVLHKKNGGATSARKMGVENAKGKWILFSDADDTMPKESIYDLLLHDDGISDIIAGTILYKSRKRIIRTETASDSIGMDEYIHLLLNRGTYYGPCAKLIRRDLFDGLGWNDDPRVFQNEDLLMLVQLASKSTRNVSICNEHVHYICEDKVGSISTKHMSYEGWKLLFQDLRSIIIPLSNKNTYLFSDYVNYTLWTIYDCLLTQAINVPQDAYVLSLIKDSKKADVSDKNKNVLLYLVNPVQRKIFCVYRNLRMSLKYMLKR